MSKRKVLPNQLPLFGTATILKYTNPQTGDALELRQAVPLAHLNSAAQTRKRRRNPSGTPPTPKAARSQVPPTPPRAPKKKTPSSPKVKKVKNTKKPKPPTKTRPTKKPARRKAQR